MSSALALEYVRTWFRTKYNWLPNQCDVTYNAEPTFDAGKFFIGIDDGGVDVGNDLTDSLKESVSIRIGIWRRPEHFMHDRKGLLKLKGDLYLAGAWTLHKLERMVIVHGPHDDQYGTGLNQDGLHRNYEFLNGLNTYFNLPIEENGAQFVSPFIYKGKGGMESLAIEKTPDSFDAWLGYRLRFTGLYREQKIRSITDAVA